MMYSYLSVVSLSFSSVHILDGVEVVTVFICYSKLPVLHLVNRSCDGVVYRPHSIPSGQGGWGSGLPVGAPGSTSVT